LNDPVGANQAQMDRAGGDLSVGPRAHEADAVLCGNQPCPSRLRSRLHGKADLHLGDDAMEEPGADHRVAFKLGGQRLKELSALRGCTGFAARMTVTKSSSEMQIGIGGHVGEAAVSDRG
jgi:hypothetical protein